MLLRSAFVCLFAVGCGLVVVEILMVDVQYWKMSLCFGYVGGWKLGLGSGFFGEEREFDVSRVTVLEAGKIYVVL